MLKAAKELLGQEDQKKIRYILPSTLVALLIKKKFSLPTCRSVVNYLYLFNL